MPIKHPDTMSAEMPEDKKPRPLNEAIADEVRKDQGMTPTFPFGERELEEKSVGEVEDDAVLDAREKAEIERVPGGGPRR